MNKFKDSDTWKQTKKSWLRNHSIVRNLTVVKFEKRLDVVF